MGILKQHLCPAPKYEKVRIGEEPADWAKYWQCDACMRVWERGHEDNWDDRWVEVPKTGWELFWAKVFVQPLTKEVRKDIFPKSYWAGWILIDGDIDVLYVEREDGAVTPMRL